MAITQIRGNTQILAGTILDAQIAAAAAIATSKLAEGTLFLKKDGSVAMTAAFNAGNQTIINLGSPINPTDAATKGYVDTLVTGRDWKESCRVASTANVTIPPGGTTLTIDGVALANGNRVLLKDQTTASQNGIHVVGGIGSSVTLTRASDAIQGQLTSQSTTFIEEGTANAGTEWNLTTPDPITVGTTNQTWVKSGSTSTYTGNNGIQVVGTIISPVYGSAANTVCEGNDPRLSDARTPVGTALTAGSIWVGNGSNLAAAVAPSGDVSSISAAGAFTLASTIRRTTSFVIRETPTGTINGSNATFTLANTPVAGTDEVFLNGILQEAGAGNDYVLTGTSLVFNTAPLSGDRVKVNYQV
jgi:hypothetical protein